MEKQFEDEYLNEILRIIPTSVLVFDKRLNLLSVSQHFCDKTGRKAESVLSRHITYVLPTIVVEELKLDDKIKSVFHTGKPFPFALPVAQMEYRAPGLPRLFYSYRIKPIKNRKGVVEAVILLMEDITLTKRITDTDESWEWQQHLERVVESANDMVISIDTAKRIKSWNSAAELLTGYPLYSVSEQPIEPMLIHPAGRSDIIDQLLSGKMVGQYVEIGIRTKDGSQIPISWGSALMKNERNEKMGLVLVGRNLAEQHELEQEILQQAKMTSLGVMAGGVAHEIKNPLAVIGGAAQLLEKRYPGEFVQKSVKMIRDAVCRASKVVDNLLHFARREPQTSFELLSINRIVEDAFSMLENQINLQQIKINKTLDDDLPLILGNANQLQQVVMNLMLNAQSAMPKGGELTLATTNVNNQVVIKCSDTGEGISAEDLEKIFDPFYTTRVPGKGTGLGLSISYQIIQQHDGIIEPYSAGRNKGSSFTVKLPIYTAEKEYKNGKTW